MAQGDPFSMQAIQSSELAPIVAQVIDNRRIDSLEWRVQPVSGVGGGTAAGMVGLLRLIGSAKSAGQVYPWSVIVKVFNGSNPASAAYFSAIPAAWNYWKREILAYRSGILAELTGNLIAPRCYGVTEHPNDEWRIWLEDIQETPKMWPMERHGLAARHLGQFNGAYLTSRALPEEQPWMYRGRAGDWIKEVAPIFGEFQQYASSVSGQRWLTEQSVERLQRLLLNHRSLLAMLDSLPVCLCHHDAFRRNLLARDGPTAEAQTVAIDWSMLGYGRVGEEVGITTAVALWWLDVTGEQAREMDRITFASYVDGLRDAGWRGDARLARFGYTTTASLVVGVAGALFMGTDEFSSAEGLRATESAIGFKLDDIFEQWAVVHPFLLDLGDEALRLMDEIG